jgi:SAM-dependent methyltransferase
VPCCICERVDAEPVGVGEDFEYRTGPDTFLAMQCQGCGLVYLDPRPTRAELPRMYPSNYHAFHFDEADFGVVYHVRSYLEAARLRRWCRGLSPTARILDVGCGDGFHLHLLRRWGSKEFRLEGVDADERAVRHARGRGLNVQLGFLDQLRLDADAYDCVLLIQTIEHVDDPPGLLAEIRRILRPGGRVVIVTDNTGSLDFRWFRGRWWGGYHFPRHLQLFDRSSMTALAAKAGFSVHELSTIVSPVNWVYSVRNALDDLGSPRRLVEQFSLETPATLALGTLWDAGNRVVGQGALLRADLRKPA